MSEQQTYKAKSTSLIVMLLVFFSALGNKTWKTFHLPLHFSPIKNISSIVPETKKEESKNGNNVTPIKSIVYRKPIVKSDSIKIDSTVSTQSILKKADNHTNDVTKTNTIPTDRNQIIPFAKPIHKPEIENITPEKEIARLTNDMITNRLFNAGFFVTDSIKNKQTSSSDGKLSDNAGGSYYNAEVQSNMNDLMKSVYTTKLLYDSVITNSNKDFAYNTLTINNTTNNSISLQVIITSPSSWQLITTNIVNITLLPFASTIIPMRFTASKGKTSIFQQVRIEYRINNVLDTRKDFFKLKVQEYSSFKASLPNSSIVFTGYEKNNTIPLVVKNTGNTDATYKVTVENQLLKLGLSFLINIKAGKDTTMLLPYTLSASQYSMLKKEDVRIAVVNEKKETISLLQSISKVGYIIKDHESAYLDMPLQLEAGVMYQGGSSATQYYGALYGTVDFDQNNHLAMSYRSSTIASGQTNKNSMLRMDYVGKHLQASIGNVQGAGEFVVDGYGGRLGYTWGVSNKAEVFATLKSRAGDTKVYGGALQLALKKNINITDAVSISNDNVTKKNAGIINQISEIKLENGKLSLITGAGMEQNKGPLVAGTPTTIIGSSLGYNFVWNNKHLGLSSNILYNSNSYPGNFKGQRLQMHDVRWLINKHFIGAYFENNFRKTDYFQDTTLYKDIFNGKTTNYGLKAGTRIKNASITLAAGNQKQLQQGTENFSTSFDYLNLSFSTLLAKMFFINLTSFVGYLSSIGDGPKTQALVSTSQGNLQIKFVGASFRYDKGPYYYQDFATYINKPQNYERILFSPFIDLHLMKSKLGVRVQGNYAKSLPTDVSTSNMLANINYNNAKGYDFTLNGIVPIGSTSSKPYLTASFRMLLHTPFLPVKKYYNLKLSLFKDANSNGIKDRGEEPVVGQTLSLNGDLFISDADGDVIYKNTEPGIYKADFGYSSKLKGWMPSAGMVQNYDLSSNNTVYVPYKVSRVLSGKLMVVVDSLSNIPFNPSNIKVTATSESGEVYSTLTDNDGSFYFNLPSGNYIVSLSEVAFSSEFKPVQFAQSADLANNNSKSLYFVIKQRKRQINIKRK